MSKPIQLSAKTLKSIAESLFLAYTAEQAAYMAGVSKNTLARIKDSQAWVEILSQAAQLEKPYRKKIYKGEPGWQGAAWMLERKYASQFARPDIQLSLNTSNTTTNQTIVITAEQAGQLKARNASLDAELDKLTPPGAKPEINRLLEPIKHTGPIIPIMSPEHISSDIAGSMDASSKDSLKASQEEDPFVNQKTNTTKSIGVVEETPPAPATRTPDAGSRGVEPNLPPNSKSVSNSSNYGREKRKKRSQGTKARAALAVPPIPAKVAASKILKKSAVDNSGKSKKPGKSGVKKPFMG